jgi:ribulose-5-phosphate 4-epimerase/fuculose-1-phosphate aldolase
VHSHALSAVLVSDLAEADDHLVIAGFEMLKGIHGGSNREVHRVPVIDNTAEEFELAGTVADVLQRAQFAPTRCVLVRDHGAYVWGEDVEEATRHAEVYHFLFEGVLERRRIREGRR